MNLALILALILAMSVALAALLRCRKLEKQLAFSRRDFRILNIASTNDFQQTLNLRVKHDRLLGEKNQLIAMIDNLKFELRRKHRRVRGVGL